MSSHALALAQEVPNESMTPSLVGALGAVLLVNHILALFRAHATAAKALPLLFAVAILMLAWWHTQHTQA